MSESVLLSILHSSATTQSWIIEDFKRYGVLVPILPSKIQVLWFPKPLVGLYWLKLYVPTCLMRKIWHGFQRSLSSLGKLMHTCLNDLQKLWFCCNKKPDEQSQLLWSLPVRKSERQRINHNASARNWIFENWESSSSSGQAVTLCWN
jgi:hypothetical protein